MRLFIGALFTASLSLAACGGGGGDSGLDSSKELGTLTADELSTLCEYVVSASPSEPVECDGFTYEPTTQTECESDPFPETCTATVGNAEACADAIGDDPCTAFESAACADLLECFGA